MNTLLKIKNLSFIFIAFWVLCCQLSSEVTVMNSDTSRARLNYYNANNEKITADTFKVCPLDTLQLSLQYFRRIGLPQDTNIVIQWGALSNSVFDTITFNQAIKIHSSQPSNTILINVLSKQDTERVLFTDTVVVLFTNGSHCFNIEYFDHIKQKTLSADTVKTCIPDSIHLQAKLYSQNSSEQPLTHVGFVWELSNTTYFKIEPGDDSLAKVLFYSFDNVGSVDVVIKVYDSLTPNETLLIDTLTFLTQNSVQSGCLVLDYSFSFKGNALDIPLTQNDNNRVQINFGEQDTFQLLTRFFINSDLPHDQSIEITWKPLNNLLQHQLDQCTAEGCVSSLLATGAGNTQLEVIANDTARQQTTKDTIDILIMPATTEKAFQFTQNGSDMFSSTGHRLQGSLVVADSFVLSTEFLVSDTLAPINDFVLSFTLSDSTVIEYRSDSCTSKKCDGVVLSNENTGSAFIYVSLTDTVMNMVYTDTLLINVVSALASRQGTFNSSSGYGISGSFSLIEQADGSLQLHFHSDFTFNGAPGPVVYLSQASNSVNSGVSFPDTVHSRGGVHVFDVSDGISLNDYNYVVIWCMPFRTPLGWGQFDE